MSLLHTPNEAAKALSTGKVIAYPTETVYGLGCDPSNQTAVETLLRIKQRPIEKGLIVIAGELTQLTEWVDIENLKSEFPFVINSWAEKSEQPTTWCVPCRTNTPKWLTGEFDTLAIRISNHPKVSALCSAFGKGIVSTSANPNGRSPAQTYQEAMAYFPELNCLEGLTNNQAKPSIIKDARTRKIMRA